MENIRPYNLTGFSQFLGEHRLMGTRCLACGQVFLPPRPLCTRCFSSQMEWQELSGEGALIAFTTIYVGLPALAEEGYSRDEPYCTGIIRLVEGPAIPGRILGFDCAQPEAIRIGLPVQAVFIDKAAGSEREVLLAFRERKGIF